jgi:hypothetical protein
MNTLTTSIDIMENLDEGAISDTSSDLDSRASSPDPDYHEGNLLTEAMENEVTAQLVAAGKFINLFIIEYQKRDIIIIYAMCCVF